MGAPKAKQSSTLRYARLLSFLSITFTLFMLGALGLVYVLEQGLSKEVRERISFSVELSDEPGANTEATLSELRALPYVRSVELISADSAAKSLTDVLGEDPTKILGYNPLQPMAKVYLKSEYTEPDSLKKIIATNPVLKNAEGLEEQQSQWASASNEPPDRPHRPLDLPRHQPAGELPADHDRHGAGHLLAANAYPHALAHRCYGGLHRPSLHPSCYPRGLHRCATSTRPPGGGSSMVLSRPSATASSASAPAHPSSVSLSLSP